MTQTIDLAPPARQVAAVARNITDDQLDNPTPCTELSVSGLIDHLLGLSSAFRDAAVKVGGTTSPEVADPAELNPQWRTALPARLEELVQAWQDPAAWEGMTEAGGVALPGDVAGQVAVDEIVMHGWDLARATGQDFTCDPATAKVVFEFAKAAAEEENGGGIFGPAVAVPEDAPLFERALGYAGRDPAWSAGGRHARR